MRLNPPIPYFEQKMINHSEFFTALVLKYSKTCCMFRKSLLIQPV